MTDYKNHLEQRKFDRKMFVRLCVVLAMELLMLGITIGLMVSTYGHKNVSQETISPTTTVAYAKIEVRAYITGYNTTADQTDGDPCIGAGNKKICGRSDVVACPRNIPLGTKVNIRGKVYECLDRTAKRYDGRFDISCDKDRTCPNKVTGHTTVTVYMKG